MYEPEQPHTQQQTNQSSLTRSNRRTRVASHAATDEPEQPHTQQQVQRREGNYIDTTMKCGTSKLTFIFLMGGPSCLIGDQDPPDPFISNTAPIYSSQTKLFIPLTLLLMA